MSVIPDPSLPTVPQPTDPLELVSYADADHTNASERRSTTGHAACLAGSAIAYRSKTKPICAQSSTEAQLIAACAAAKVIKYLRSMLKQLGFPQMAPTILYEENMSTIDIVNTDRPTPRSRTVNIQYFVLQH